MYNMKNLDTLEVDPIYSYSSDYREFYLVFTLKLKFIVWL